MLMDSVMINHMNIHVWYFCCWVSDAAASDTFSLGQYNLYAAKVSYTFTIPCPVSQNIFLRKTSKGMSGLKGPKGKTKKNKSTTVTWYVFFINGNHVVK